MRAWFPVTGLAPMCPLTSGPETTGPRTVPSQTSLRRNAVGTAILCACVSVSPGPCFSQAWSPLLSFLTRPGEGWFRVLSPHPSPHMGRCQSAGAAASPAHLLCAPRPRLPRSSGGDREENSPILRGVCCLVGRQETRGNWLKKPVRLGRLQASPGQTGGCQAGSGGGEPGAGLRHMGRIQQGSARHGQLLAGLY